MITNDISSNETKIAANETNISSNLDKINEHIDLIAKAKRSGDLSLNQILLEKPEILANETNISSNLDKIGVNETKISSNLGNIETNVTDISSLSSKYQSVLWRSNNNNGLVNQAHDKIKILEEGYNKIKEIIKGDEHYILKNLCLLELDFVRNLKIEENKEELVNEKTINDVFKEGEYLQLNETIYYQFDNVKTDLHLIKEHYIILRIIKQDI